MTDSFRRPASYEALVSAGVLTGSSTGDLWLYDMEWIPPSAVSVRAFSEIGQTPIVPFAKTGGGDWWCWLCESSDDEHAVVFCPSDDCTATVYADSFAAALFRHILDFVSQYNITEGNSGEMPIGEARSYLAQWQELLGPYLPKLYNDVIVDLITREPQLYWESPSTDGYLVLMTPESVEELLRATEGFMRFDEEFDWVEIES